MIDSVFRTRPGQVGAFRWTGQQPVATHRSGRVFFPVPT
jgi:hypothetical protein